MKAEVFQEIVKHEDLSKVLLSGIYKVWEEEKA